MEYSFPKLVSTLCHQIIQSKIQRDEISDFSYKKIHNHALKKAYSIFLKKCVVPEKTKSRTQVTENVRTLLLLESLHLKIKNENDRASLLQECISKFDVEKYENIIHVLLNLKGQRLGNVACQNLISLERLFYNSKHFIFLEPIKPSLDLKQHNKMSIKKNNYLPWFNLEDFDAPPKINFSNINFLKNSKNSTQLNTIEFEDHPRKSEKLTLFELTELCLEHSNTDRMDNISESKAWMEFFYSTYEKYLNSIALFSANPRNSILGVINIPEKEFSKQVIDMLFGFSSRTFKWNEKTQYFEKNKYVCIEGVLPESINAYCESLIVTASLHKRLLKLIERPIHRHGLFYKVFCVKLFDILKWYNIPLETEKSATSLLRIKYYLPHLEETIYAIACCFCVTDEYKKQEVPKGNELLIHIEKIYWSTHHLSTAQAISRYILVLAYDVYIKIYIIPWILEGTLLPNKEFFIERSSHVYNKSRKFWSQEFRLVPDKTLPNLFKNEAETILTCGKNIHLMNNISFLTRYIPKYETPFKLGVTLKEVLDIKLNYKRIYDTHCQMYSPIITYKILKTLTYAKEQELVEHAIKVQEETMKRLKFELEEKVRKTILEKEKQAKLRCQELQKNEEDKAMAIYNEQLQSLNELRKIEDIKKAREEEIEREKKKLIEYYTELTDMADKKYQLANIRTEELTEILTLLQKTSLSPNEIRTLGVKLTPTYKKDQINLADQKLDTTNQNQDAENVTNRNIILKNLNLTLNHNTNITSSICDNATTPTNNNLLITSQSIIESQSSIDLLKQYNENAAAARRNKAKVLTQEMNIDFSSRTVNKPKSIVSKIETIPVDNKDEKKENISELSDDIVKKPEELAMTKDDTVYKFSRPKGFLLKPLPKIKNRRHKRKTERNKLRFLVKRSNMRSYKKDVNFRLKKCNCKIVKSIIKNPYLSYLKDRGEEVVKKKIRKQRLKKLSYVNVCVRLPIYYNLEVPLGLSDKLCLKESNLDIEENMRTQDHLNRICHQLMNSKLKENGKYIKVYNVDAECFNRHDSNEEYYLYLTYSFQFLLLVQYHLLNHLTLKYFLCNENLVDHFNSLREYYFLANGHFQNLISKELCEVLHEIDYPQELFNHKTLNEIMNNALLYSNIKNQNRISFKIAYIPSAVNLESADILDGIELVYLTEWPLNIFITDSIIAKYNKVFNYLIKIKRTQWVLNEIFYELKVLVKEPGFEEILVMNSPDYKSMQFIRHVMNTWITSLLRHIMGTVLHLEWIEFENILLDCRSLNEIHSAHKKYLNSVIFKCSLNENAQEFIAAIYRTFECVYTIYNLLRCRQWYLKENDQYYTHPNMKKIKTCFQNFKQFITYIIKMSKKQIKREYQPHLEYLLLMFDFNSIFENEKN